MRSHSSHRSSHRSSLSSRSHSSLHRSSLGRSIMHRSSISGISHKSAFKKHGISNAHAFAVGKATGININASAQGAHGAALHRFKKIRDNNSIHRHSRGINRGFTSRHRTSEFMKKMHVSHRFSSSKKRYTSNKINFSQFENVGEEFNKTMTEMSKYIWIPIVAIGVMFIIFILMIFFIINMRFIFFK